MVVIEVVTGQRFYGIFEENSLLNYACSLQGRNALLEGVHRMLEGKYDEQQVKTALLVGLACLHPDTKGRPTIREVEQILLKPNEPLMKVSESRPTAIFVPLYSSASTTRSTAVLGLKVTMPCCSQPLDKIITHHEDCDI
jgi:hypothetical protein